MTGANELGTFLRTRRERVGPADAGLPTGSGVRRTPGLRREELAALAGVSVDYYTRVERGKEKRPSVAVLEALARVLRLDDAEREHLRALAARAAHHPTRPAARPHPQVRRTARLLLDTLRPNPALVVSRTNDVLAATPSGMALFPGLAGYPPGRRNLIRYAFLHPGARDLWDDWEGVVSGTVAHLRSAAGEAPDDPDVTGLVGELLVKSPDFARIWHRYEVRPRSAGEKAFLHPAVGRMRLEFESMPLAGTGGQRLVVYLAGPGTPDHDAMVLLDMLATTDSAEQPSSGADDRLSGTSRPSD